MTGPLLEFEDVTIQYETASGMLTAASDVSFRIDGGDYFGLVGESGCVKSTVADAIVGGLDENGQVMSGTIRYRGEEIQPLSERELNERIRWKEIAWIPQGSMNSLDPLQKVGEQAVEIAETHTDLTRDETLEKFGETLEIVGLSRERMFDYPHQFSGGMQQRAMIALALFLEPSFLIADEPTTALDVIMQDQIFKHLDEIQEETEVGILLITHDISVVFESCNRIGVMHGGQMAEVASTSDLFDSPRHPYSILLQEAFPDIRYPDRDLTVIEGTPPKNIGEVDYCTFTGRCPWEVTECSNGAPPQEPVDTPNGVDESHLVSCIRKEEVYRQYEEDGVRELPSREEIQ